MQRKNVFHKYKINLLSV